MAPKKPRARLSPARRYLCPMLPPEASARLLSFSPAMLTAVRESRKTVTRRRFAPALGFHADPDRYVFRGMESGCALFEEALPSGEVRRRSVACPFGQPGDVVSVPEEPSIRLRIVTVRAEQVQAITEAEARAEGIVAAPGPGFRSSTDDGRRYESAREAFRALITGFYPDAWVRNEWVWVVRFEVVG